jgi:hypothetical protein
LSSRTGHVLIENSRVVRIEDDGKYWVWIRHRTRAARRITGKIGPRVAFRAAPA